MFRKRSAGLTAAGEPIANGIFISYRRDDTSGHVIALMDRLSARFGEERIFKDTDNILPGQDFVEEVKRQLASCAVTLVVIGREWLTVPHPRHPGRRLDDPKDLVRLEVSTSLAVPRVLVIPVLVDRATMPAEEDLPADIQALARRNYIELTDSRWKADTEHLLDRIDEAIAVSAPRAIWQAVSTYSVHVLVVAVVVLTALLAMSFDWDSLTESVAARPSGVTTTTPVSQPPPTTPAVSQETIATDTPKSGGVDTAPRPETPRDKDVASRPTGNRNPPKATSSTPAPRPPEKKPEVTIAANPPTTTSTPQAPVQSDAEARRAILEVLERFRQAYNSKNEQAVTAVYPGVRADGIFRNLRDCARLTLEFGQPRLFFLSPTEAQVDVNATYGCRPTTAQGSFTSPAVNDVYRFTRRDESWVIDNRFAAVDRKKP